MWIYQDWSQSWSLLAGAKNWTGPDFQTLVLIRIFRRVFRTNFGMIRRRVGRVFGRIFRGTFRRAVGVRGTFGDVPTVLLDGKNTQSDQHEVSWTVLSGWGARMGSPRPSSKGRRSRKVAVGSNSLKVPVRRSQVASRKSQVESRKVEGWLQMSRSRSLLRSKYSKRWGRIVYCSFRSYLPSYIHGDTTIR